MTEKETTIYLPIFNYHIDVVYTDNISESREARNHLIGAQDEVLHRYVDGLHSYNKQEPKGFIFFTEKSSVGVIAHEVFHAIWRMFKYIGAKHENEVFAYHLSWILDRVLEFKKETDEVSRDNARL